MASRLCRGSMGSPFTSLFSSSPSSEPISRSSITVGWVSVIFKLYSFKELSKQRALHEVCTSEAVRRHNSALLHPTIFSEQAVNFSVDFARHTPEQWCVNTGSDHVRILFHYTPAPVKRFQAVVCDTGTDAHRRSPTTLHTLQPKAYCRLDRIQECIVSNLPSHTFLRKRTGSTPAPGVAITLWRPPPTLPAPAFRRRGCRRTARTACPPTAHRRRVWG